MLSKILDKVFGKVLTVLLWVAGSLFVLTLVFVAQAIVFGLLEPLIKIKAIFSINVVFFIYSLLLAIAIEVMLGIAIWFAWSTFCAKPWAEFKKKITNKRSRHGRHD